MKKEKEFDSINYDPGFYKFGFLYYNPRDNRTLVPKSTRLGWTMNFARLNTYLFIICLIAIIIISIFFLKA